MDSQHVVGRVACGGESATPSTGLVHRAGVAGLRYELGHFAGNKPDLGTQVKEVCAGLEHIIISTRAGHTLQYRTTISVQASRLSH